MLRRRPDPRELASVLHRLERLRVVAQPVAPGWLPHAPDADGTDARPASDAPKARPRRAKLRELVPARLHISAFDPGRRGVAVLVVVAVLGASGGAWYFLRAAPHVQATDASAVAGTGANPSANPTPGSARSPTESVAPTEGFAPVGVVALPSGLPSSSKATDLVVDVVGKVVKPGVFTLPAGSRIVDAIAAAGGALPHTDLTALDLARKLSDGQEIFVGIPPPSGPANGRALRRLAQPVAACLCTTHVLRAGSSHGSRLHRELLGIEDPDQRMGVRINYRHPHRHRPGMLPHNTEMSATRDRVVGDGPHQAVTGVGSVTSLPATVPATVRARRELRPATPRNGGRRQTGSDLRRQKQDGDTLRRTDTAKG